MRSWVLLLVLGQAVGCGGSKPPELPHGGKSPATKPLPLVPSSPLADGLSALAKSDYGAARKALTRAAENGQTQSRALLALAELDLTEGQYERAAQASKLLEAEPAQRAAHDLIRAKALRAVGNLDAAVAILSRQGAGAPSETRLLLGELLLEAGRIEEANAALLSLVQDYNEERVASDDVAGLARVGRAAHLLRSSEDANDAFNQAETAGPASNEVLLWRAELYLDHEDLGHAEEVIAEVLKRAPKHPEASLWMARVVLEQAQDFEQAKALVKTALEVNPRSAGAYAILAGIALRDMQLDDVGAEISKGLAINPRDLLLLSLSGTRLFLAEDAAGYAQVKAQVLAFNPHYSGFFVTVAKYADWEHRYAEIVEMMREATQLDPDDARVQAEFGFNLIRNGDDKSGLRALQRAFAGDPYNVRVFNTLHLYEEVIPKAYVDVPGTPFVFRYPKAESAVLQRTLAPMLKDAWQKMRGYYDFTPTVPVQIELYAERENFSIRTLGLPHTAIQGVCFGRTLASMTPRQEQFNLGITVWHELAHVFHIQLSRSRVPRWFTEGLAEYETLVERPEWRREQDPDLYRALRAGRLPRLKLMNQAFTHAEDGRDVAVAYYASSQIVRMLAENYGRPKLRRMLELWGQGKTQDQVFADALGKTAEQLDVEVQQYLDQRLVRFKGQFMPQDRVGNPDDLRRILDKQPEDVPGLIRLALLQMQQGHAKEALQVVDQALHIAPTDPDALQLKARWALQQGNAILAEALVVKLLDGGHDGYETQLLRAKVMAAREQLAEVRASLTRAHQFDPDEAEPVVALLDFAVGDQRIEMLKKLAAIDEHRGETYRELGDLLLAAGRNEEALAVAQSGVFSAMESPAAYVVLARALARLGKRGQADEAFETALLCPGHDKERAAAEAAFAEHLRATNRAQQAGVHEARAKARAAEEAADAQSEK